ncbi:hypothetical protein [Pseudomonas fluorescens]|uniref:hypothetical protein n=1 Tax=Pseudomonas fluorescens TaxID=294 RepID=UPI001BEBB51E|nr:hypothetical protein [Pseudomonas fluorescens]MBT2375108.1 hypothetical protein [Pseudomonas fluorescens]
MNITRHAGIAVMVVFAAFMQTATADTTTKPGAAEGQAKAVAKLHITNESAFTIVVARSGTEQQVASKGSTDLENVAADVTIKPASEEDKLHSVVLGTNPGSCAQSLCLTAH